MNKALIALCALTIVSALSSCVTTDLQVVNQKTKAPVPSASIVAVNGNYSSSAVYTDANGYAVAPTLPMGAKELVIKKSGYQSKTVKISP